MTAPKIRGMGRRIDTLFVEARFPMFQDHIDAMTGRDALFGRLRTERLVLDHLEQVVKKEIDRIIEAAKKAAEA